MSEVTSVPPRWQSLVGHGLTVLALSLGGLSSFFALKAEVVEVRATLRALAETEAEHYRRGEAALRDVGQRRDLDLQQLRDEIKELRADLRELRLDLKNRTAKGDDKP